ncbi:ROK family transcriptional regulator [Pseudooceanicola sp. CBS1P-1]|uniref:ROK family protein n=1 Tax=Pseudooceanicola albus TaxID=2692189 RepID=A0A6L7GCV5_9RHOB|nr:MULTISPECIES: ROK family transcriptional regulator [Pseudooceanicola]MBT9387007.1 ROK family transcriptional regulator [Pseudooceanicola endophyticus]MXN21126.1 ROK family protein [Pseudooceanicola albus]
MDLGEIRKLSDGVNQLGARAHNERLILSVIQRHGALPGRDIAGLTGLSAQTVSNILRKLETEGFLQRGTPQRGRVGKPSVPMSIRPDAALSFGLKIGRRSADLVVMNLAGEVLGASQSTYRYPMPDEIFAILEQGIADLSRALSPYQRSRLCGIGIAAPSEIWSWTEVLGAPQDFSVWRDTDVSGAVARISPLPLFTENDGTAATRAEHVFGRGRAFSDYAHFFIGSFIGGGVVLNSTVMVGAQKNAGAFGSLRVPAPGGAEVPLLDAASLYLLEAALAAEGLDTAALWRMPQDWSAFERHIDPWIVTTARALAHAIRSIGSVLDFEAVLIDGAMPAAVRDRVVARTREELARLDTRGMIPPRPEAGSVGANARALGAAIAPIYAQYFFQ